MNKPWKTMAGRCIYQAPGGEKVHQNFFYRWLTLNSDALQTLISRRHPEKPGLPYINQLTFAVRLLPATCCLFGLGGANVAHTIASYLGDSQLIAVESNPDVIKIASRYFMTDRLKNIKIIHQDACLYARECQARYQHLMIDLFSANAFPEQCNNTDFFSFCRRMLLPEGILAINLANLHEQWSVFNMIRQQFNYCTVSLPVEGTANMVVLAYNGTTVAPLLDLLKTSRCLEKLIWDYQWGCVALLRKGAI